MRITFLRLAVTAALLSSTALAGAFAAPSYASSGTICTGNQGSIKMSPGLVAATPEHTTAQVQNITIKGVLSGCTGSTVSGAKYVAHLKTSGPVDCSVLGTGETASGSVVVKWTPKGQGNSHGTMTMALGASSTVMEGKLEAGPLEGLGIYGPIAQSFGACGGKKLKLGSFSGSEFRVAAPPKATIESPANEGVYTQNQVVPTAFSCAESTFGPGLESCEDSNGATGGSGTLETATLGEHTYSVTARSIDGQKDKATIHYEVVEPV